jgi:hypothetical protein
MPSEKPAVSFRLSESVRDLIRDLARHHGLSQAAVVEIAVRELARRGVGPLKESGGRRQ